MTTPIFAPGGKAGMAPVGAENSFAPLDWILQHPATRRWWGHAERVNVGAGEVIDPAIDLSDGFEGIILRMVLTGKALGSQGANAGTAWRIYLDRVVSTQSLWTFGGSQDTSGRFDYLYEGDGLGTSWGDLNLWIQENAIVEVGMNNNGGTSDAMGWHMWGAYWPTTLREQYETYLKARQRAMRQP